MIAAVPALLDVVPTESVVVLLLTGPRAYAAIRVDAVREADPSMFGDIASRAPTDAAILIAVADTSAHVAVDLVTAIRIELATR
ncbi:MAG: DUF4192 family protein, partial [Aldersonia sp.]|nr:DUF4192 family protein [Aldersonia sp.]